MASASKNSFGTLDTLQVDGKSYEIFRLSALEKKGVGHVSKLPFSLRVLLENLLRQEDGRFVHPGDIEALAGWERRMDEAAAAIGADQIAHPNDLFAGFADKPGRHAVPVLLQPDQLASELWPVSELDEAPAHHAFGQELRHQQCDVIGLGGRWVLRLHDS